MKNNGGVQMSNELKEQYYEENIADLCKDYDCIFGLNRGIARAIPDIRDSLKPSQRRVLYSMYMMGLKPLKGESDHKKKLASISGKVLDISQHGNSSAEGVIADLAQDFNNNAPLIRGYGAFGVITDPEPAAARYIAATISEIGWDCYFKDFNNNCVDMIPSYDDSTVEPEYLPGKYPVVLFNGTKGVAYAIKTNIPTYNVKEVLETVLLLIDDPDAKFTLIPDSPTGADIIMEKQPYAGKRTVFDQINEVGIATYRQRVSYVIDNDKNTVTITALPYKSKDLKTTLGVIERQQAEMKKFPELIEISDLSELNKKSKQFEVKVVFTLANGANPYKFLERVFKEVPAFTVDYNIRINMVDNYRVKLYSIRGYLNEWITLRREHIRTKMINHLTALKSDLSVVKIKLFIFDANHYETTSNIFKHAYDTKEVIANLMKEYHDSIGMTSQQALVLSEMKNKDRLISSYEKYEAEYNELMKLIPDIERLVNDKNGVNIKLKEEIQEGIMKFGVKRKSRIIQKEIKIDDSKHDSYTVILSENGKDIKKVTIEKTDDSTLHIIKNLPKTHVTTVGSDSQIMVFDDSGHYETIQIKDIPLNQEVPLERFVKWDMSTPITVHGISGDFDDTLIIVTKFGYIKRFNPILLKSNNLKQKSYIGLDDIVKGDSIVDVFPARLADSSHMIICTNNGYGQKCKLSDIRVLGQNAKQLKFINLNKGDFVVSAFKLNTDTTHMVYVSQRGKMRLNMAKYFPERKNKDELIKIVDISDRDKLLAVKAVNANDVISLIYDDLTLENIQLGKLKTLTMSSPLVKVSDRSGLLTIINVRRVVN
jgi:DNA gyrase subunit A